MSSIRSAIEFRIFHEVFCDQYHIGTKSLAFDEYVQKIYEVVLMDMVQLQPLDWLIFLVLIFANWARSSLHLDMHSCQQFNQIEQEYELCVAESSIQLFTIFGIES